MAQPTKVFVGSLPPGTKPEELRHLFEKYGIVVECDVMNRCGFVHMKNAAMAESAIVALNASEFKGQTIVVEHGRPKERKQIGGGGGRGASGRGGNQISTRGRRGNVGDGMGHMLVGFPSGQNSNGLSQAATLQLADMVMELLGDQQNQIDDISGGNNMRGGGGGGSSGGNDHGFRRGSGGGRRSGNFQGSNRGGNQNMNGVGPIRNQGFKLDRPGPYSQGINMQPGSTGGGRYNNQANGYQDRNSMDGRGGVGPGGNFNNTRGNNNNARGGNFNNNARGGNFAPKSAPSNYASGNISWNNDQRGVGSMPPQQGGRNFSEDNFAGGFSGNMGNRSGGNFGGQQDRRGFTLPSNQFDQYGGSSNNSGSGFVSNDVGVRSSFNDEAMFHRRTNNQSNVGDGTFNRGSNQGGQDAVGGRPGGFQINRGSQQGFQEQQGSGFKRRGNNMRNSGDNYQQNFPPLGGGNQGAFGNNRFQGGQGGRGGGGGGGMNRNAPRQTMPMRRY